MITEEEKEKVRAATDLVALVSETVELRQRGREFWGCCPFHDEKTPSFHVIPATQVWHCFGCGTGGDCFSYVQKRENLSFPEAIRYLADRAGIELADDGTYERRGTKRTRLIEVCEATADFYHTMLMRGKDGRPRDYFKSRGFGADVCRRYRLGFAPGRGSLVAHLRTKGFTPREMIDANVAVERGRGVSDRFYDRVMFPIMDEQGRCIAFGGRIMGDGQPKYLNTSETALFHKKRNLYAFNWSKNAIVAAGGVVVTEGYTDTIALREAGIENVVATLGTALTEHHVKTLSRFAKRITYLFDGDEAGQRAAERAIQFIENASTDLRCVILPEGQDPAEYVGAHGGDAMRELLDHAEPLMDFVFRRLTEKADVSTPGGRAKALGDACRLLYPVRASYMIDTYYMQIADRLGIDLATVRESAQATYRDVAREESERKRREQARARAAERSAASGATASGQRAQAPAGPSSFPAPLQEGSAEGDVVPYGEVDAYVPADAYAPDEVPPDAYGSVPVELAAPDAQGGAPAGFEVLTEQERRSLRCERELLTLMTSHPDAFRPFADRITEIPWVDPRNEAVAWAVLATPEGSTAQECMAAARAVCPDAAEIVSAGVIEVTSGHPTETNIAFLLDTLELYAAQRRLRAAQAKLRRSHELSPEERRELASSAAREVARIRELERATASVADPFASLGAPGASQGLPTA